MTIRPIQNHKGAVELIVTLTYDDIKWSPGGAKIIRKFVKHTGLAHG